MNMNHLNLPVADVAASQAFYTKYFGMETVAEVGQNFLVILRDDAGFLLNLSNFDKSTETSYNKDFHVGFYVDSREEVTRLYDRMIADGLEAKAPKKMQGRYTFYVQVPGGVLTEVACLESGH